METNLTEQFLQLSCCNRAMMMIMMRMKKDLTNVFEKFITDSREFAKFGEITNAKVHKAQIVAGT
uniref:Uncharacterized protein n=1 Tax=Strigamia maritima TaxID=126957 RepID=T1J3T0_STRMM